MRATKALGIAINDQGTGNAIGGYYCPHNIQHADVVRSSAKEAYHDTAVKRSNYHLVAGQQVTRIVTDATNGTVKVTGIEYASGAGAERSSVGVKKEAVLAAGAIHTPQLLQISGIGDSALLSSINVTTVVDLPAVGQNFHDHILLTVVNTSKAFPLPRTLCPPKSNTADQSQRTSLFPAFSPPTKLLPPPPEPNTTRLSRAP